MVNSTNVAVQEAKTMKENGASLSFFYEKLQNSPNFQ